MNKLASSPQRNTFQTESIRKKLETNPNDTDALQTLEMYENIKIRNTMREQDIEWQKNNMEYDLRTTPWILEKVKNDEVYAQNLYAAMCNNEFQRVNVENTAENLVDVLKDGLPTWSCSWRHAGGVIADMREEGDYIDWYCSGIRDSSEMDEDEFNKLTEENKAHYLNSKKYVSESVVTDEIREDLLKLGWKVIQLDELPI